MKCPSTLTRLLTVLLLGLSALLFQPAFANEPSATTININTASAEEIADALNGIGLQKAQAIVAWREQNGQFTELSQLTNIKGIGEATLARNSSRISLQ